MTQVAKKLVLKKVSEVSTQIESTKKLVLKKPITEVDPNFHKINLSEFQRDFVKELPKKEQLWDLNPMTVQKAYDRILAIWNQDEKSRNFIKHLVGGFVPYDSFARLMNVPETDDLKCAVLNFKLTGIGNISKGVTTVSMRKMAINCQCVVDKREKYSDDEIKELEDLRAALPVEIRNQQIGVGSETSDKYMLVESIFALRHFCAMLLMCNETDNGIAKILSKKMKSETFAKQSERTEIPIVQFVGRMNRVESKPKMKTVPGPQNSAYTMEDTIDTNTFSKLQALKDKMETAQQN